MPNGGRRAPRITRHRVDRDRALRELRDFTPEERRMDELLRAVYGHGLHTHERHTPEADR